MKIGIKKLNLKYLIGDFLSHCKWLIYHLSRNLDWAMAKSKQHEFQPIRIVFRLREQE